MEISLVLDVNDTLPGRDDDPVEHRLARDVLEAALKHFGWTVVPSPGEDLDDGTVAVLELTLTITGDDGIRSLNREYRGRDESTDVLSFPLLEPTEGMQLAQGQWPGAYPAGIPLLLGDIVINLPQAERAARLYGHSFQREFGFLLVHGFLHLLGFDHDTPDTEKEMNELSEQILRSTGLTRAGSGV